MIGRAVLVLELAAAMACGPVRDASDAQQRAQPVVEAGCRALEALTSNGWVEAICATEPELAAIADAIRAERTASRRASAPSSCRLIPTTTLCATDAELAPAIRRVRLARGDASTD